MCLVCLFVSSLEPLEYQNMNGINSNFITNCLGHLGYHFFYQKYLKTVKKPQGRCSANLLSKYTDADNGLLVLF